jgi:hypothetical protein
VVFIAAKNISDIFGWIYQDYAPVGLGLYLKRRRLTMKKL